MIKFPSLSHNFLLQSATISAIVVAATLVIGKAFAYSLTNSLSIKASLIDSLLDGGISLVNFFAVRHAIQPPDEDHRFGHGKVEALAGLLQSLFIAGSAIWLLKEVIGQVSASEEITFHSTALVVMFGAIFLTFLLVLWQNYVIAQTQSLAISADSLHYKTDLFTNIGVLLSFYIAHTFKFFYIDWFVAALIAVYIFKTSYEIAKTSFDILMDKELSADIVAQIRAIAWENPYVKGVHDLRTRSSGKHNFIQMHLDLDGSLTLFDAHVVAEEIEQNIIAVFPDSDVIIHQDPI
ncbi:MAG: cation diffusion facilitator family transporter [Candidatus Paracaedibacteraceae bacterium]|nr:cation diffusion facilitator family transporter [Candidatus Paracaedibacteraceae bacterium]